MSSGSGVDYGPPVVRSSAGSKNSRQRKRERKLAQQWRALTLLGKSSASGQDGDRSDADSVPQEHEKAPAHLDAWSRTRHDAELNTSSGYVSVSVKRKLEQTEEVVQSEPELVHLDTVEDILTAREEGWDDDRFVTAPLHEQQEPEPPNKRQRRRYNMFTALRDYRNILLREYTRHDGLKDERLVPGQQFPACAGCCVPLPVDPDAVVLGNITCLDCQRPGLRCASCTAHDHASHPCHRLQKFNGAFFEAHTLHATGFVLQLGHDGGSCPHPRDIGRRPLIIIDTSGLHRVAYRLCGCMVVGRSDPVVQLMRARLWPSTISNPSTVVTFSTLRLFHALAIQGKVNAYDFYQGLERVTDSVVAIKNSYNAFGRCARMFRVIRLAKRAGVAQMFGGVDDVGPGDVAVRCPACPRPGVNLPEGWENAPPEKDWLYTLMFAIDANFKLKLKARAALNIFLANGWGFFPPQDAYADHLKAHDDAKESKHCSSEHTALRSAQMPTSKRWSINGVGACVCARHLFYFPQGLVDLARGERYVSMDYGVCGAIRMTGLNIKRFLFPYDISCSWSVHFRDRLREKFPDISELAEDAVFTFVVPKFHLEAHGEDCKCSFNLNHTRGVGRTCGEGVEAGWADMNAAGVFTREMSLAQRREVIDDLCNAINWRKLRSMGVSLLKQLTEARPLAIKHTASLGSLEAIIPSAILENWVAKIREWDALPIKKNKTSPYCAPVITQSLTAVKLELREAEEQEVKNGLALHDTSASTYVGAVIALEDLVYSLNVKGSRSSTQDKERLATRRRDAYVRAQTLESVQASYIVGVDGLKGRIEGLHSSQSAAARRADLASAPLTIAAELSAPKRGRFGSGQDAPAVVLWLPSNIPSSIRDGVCLGETVDKEIRMRVALCTDTIHNLRRTIRQATAYKIDSKRFGFMSQSVQTRSIATRINIQQSVLRHAEKYRRSYAALCALDPHGKHKTKWQVLLQKLKYSDLRAPNETECALDVDEVVALLDDPSTELPAVAAVSERQEQEMRASTDTPSVEAPAATAAVSERQAQKSKRAITLSWIWQIDEVAARDIPGAKTEEEAYEHVRLDWARLRSRALRWAEEVELVLEEMQRIVASYVWTANEWRTRAALVEAFPATESQRGMVDGVSAFAPDIVSGLRAHALRQAAVYDMLAADCLMRWLPDLRRCPEWDSLYWPPEMHTLVDSVLNGLESRDSATVNESVAPRAVPGPALSRCVARALPPGLGSDDDGNDEREASADEDEPGPPDSDDDIQLDIDMERRLGSDDEDEVME